MITDRGNTICLLEILKEFSDSEHILTMKEILSKMNTVYGIKPDRRTVYSAVALLIDMGYEISTYEDNGKGYYLQSRDFEQSEIMLLTDAVYSFPFISAKQSEQLIEKLQKELSSHQRKKYRHLTVVRQEHKTDNRQVFLNLELLDEAITAKKQVSFTYLDYGLDKKLHPRREKLYVVNPYGLTFTNEHYYLICNYSGLEKTSFYRLDLIKDLKQLEMDIDRKPESKSEVADAVYAFSGKPEQVKIVCSKCILKDVIDRFGTGIHIAEKDENNFTATFKAPPEGIRFWALQYLPYAEVTEPKWLRREIIESVKGNRYFEIRGKCEMKEVWTLTVKTSLPEVCWDKSDLVTTTSAYENFEDARNAMRSVLKEYAFSKNEMFNGKGYISELAFYADEAERIEKDEGIEDEDESGYLSSQKLNYIQELLLRIFEGKDLIPFDKNGSYGDGMIEAFVSNDEIRIKDDCDGRFNGYNPVIKTNMLDMTEEKDYYIYIDDMFGQDEASSELYIDLKKTGLG